MKILFIHQNRRLKTGAHYINNIIVKGLRRAKIEIDNVFPEEELGYFSPLLRGMKNILFFFSLIERKKDISSYDVIQGTTYTPIAFLHCGVPVVSMFGSTTYGFLKHVPTHYGLKKEHSETAKIFTELKDRGILSGLTPPVQPLRDISRIEMHVAKQSDKVIATSEFVKKELVKNGVSPEKIEIIWNGIDNFWFRAKPKKRVKKLASIVYLNRIESNAFNIKLKGINRLIHILRSFPDLDKAVIGLTNKPKEFGDFFAEIPRTKFFPNIKRRSIPKILRNHFGGLVLNTSRYEGFSLSLIEAMSQGLIPISFPVGVAPEIIKNGENGYLVHSTRQMILRINKLCRDKEKRLKLAQGAMQTAKTFTVEAMIKKYIAVYQSLKPADSTEQAQIGAMQTPPTFEPPEGGES